MRRSIGTALITAVVLMAAIPGQASATHVQCGDVITQNTTLDSDLIGCHGPGLEIGASNITLDLAGHTIQSDGQTNFADGQGVRVENRQGITIRNGIIKNFTVAQVEFFNVTDSVVRDLNLSGVEFTTAGVRLNGPSSQRNLVTRNTITSDSASTKIEGRGISVFGFGSPSPAGQNTIDQNTIRGYGRGIWIQDSRSNLIIANDIRQGGWSGVDLFTNADDNVVRGNTMAGFIYGASNTAVVPIFNANRNVVTGNLIADGPVNGITVGFEGAETRIEDNQLLRNGGDGLLVSQNSTRTLVLGNRADRNGDDGIDVDGPFVDVSGNHTWFNGDLGIEAVPGTTGSANWAKHNGNPAQCVGVPCSTTGKPKS